MVSVTLFYRGCCTRYWFYATHLPPPLKTNKKVVKNLNTLLQKCIFTTFASWGAHQTWMKSCKMSNTLLLNNIPYCPTFGWIAFSFAHTNYIIVICRYHETGPMQVFFSKQCNQKQNQNLQYVSQGCKDEHWQTKDNV